MDVLDNYKKAWDNQPEEANKVSKIDIYKMAHSRSSSIVKWIFIIGILEFVILLILNLTMDHSKSIEEFEKIGISNLFLSANILSYIVILYFIFQFYKNYKSISTVDSTKVLMQKILKTRKTVRNYVVFNLVFGALIIGIVTSVEINFYSDNLSTKQIWIAILLSFVVAIVFLALLYGFYQLLYGILLRKLNRNYKELAKLDASN